jgi:hypothetical protein
MSQPTTLNPRAERLAGAAADVERVAPAQAVLARDGEERGEPAVVRVAGREEVIGGGEVLVRVAGGARGHDEKTARNAQFVSLI